jgi:hypothetical protein
MIAAPLSKLAAAVQWENAIGRVSGALPLPDVNDAERAPGISGDAKRNETHSRDQPTQQIRHGNSPSHPEECYHRLCNGKEATLDFSSLVSE